MEKEKQQPQNINITITNQSNNNAEQGYAYVKKKVINYWVALILSIFLGWLGVDRFYAGHVGLGIVKLLTFGGFFIWWFIDVILFATKSIDGVVFEV